MRKKKQINISALFIAIATIIIPMVIFGNIVDAITTKTTELSVLKVIALSIVYVPFITWCLIRGIDRTAELLAKAII